VPTALSNLQTEAKTIIVDAIDLKVCHVRKLQTKSVVDGIAQLASVFMTFYGISSTNAMADPMVKYHLFNAIAHKDFDALFLSTGISRRSSSTARQTDNIFR